MYPWKCNVPLQVLFDMKDWVFYLIPFQTFNQSEIILADLMLILENAEIFLILAA